MTPCPNCHSDRIPCECRYREVVQTSNEIVYRAQYRLGIDGEFRDDKADALADLKDGFWVNEEMKFTKGSDARYWIPPAMLIVIVKEHAMKGGRT